MGLEAGFGSQCWDLDLEARILARRLGLEARILASRLRFEGWGAVEKEEKEKGEGDGDGGVAEITLAAAQKIRTDRRSNN